MNTDMCVMCGSTVYLTVSGEWRHLTHDPAHHVVRDTEDGNPPRPP